MKVIMLYGPPACGKLTVAKEIQKHTGIKIYHNHLSLDYATELFAFGTKEYNELCSDIRRLTFEHAAKANIDLLYTFCYSHPEDDGYIDDLEKQLTKDGHSLLLVHLSCSHEKLRERATTESRKQYKKIQDSKTISQILEKWNFYTPIPGRQSLVIDNTAITAESTAQQIISHFKLKQISDNT